VHKVILNFNALKFKTNVEQELKLDAESTRKAGQRYECIYKNLIREIRKFYQDEFEVFVSQQIEISMQKPTAENKQILFQFHLIQFTVKLFDFELLKGMMSEEKNLKDVIHSLAFDLGCFIYHKNMIKTFKIKQTPSLEVASRAKMMPYCTKFVILNIDDGAFCISKLII
jgi:hypothetical protein